VDRWAATQDHILIDIHLLVATPEPVPSRRFALEKLNEEGLWEHISQSNWVGAPCPLTTLQRTLQEGLERHCPKAHPCAHANPQWPPRASELLAGARRARRRYITSKEEHDQVSYQSFQGLLKKELCRVGRAIGGGSLRSPRQPQITHMRRAYGDYLAGVNSAQASHKRNAHSPTAQNRPGSQ